MGQMYDFNLITVLLMILGKVSLLRGLFPTGKT